MNSTKYNTDVFKLNLHQFIYFDSNQSFIYTFSRHGATLGFILAIFPLLRKIYFAPLCWLSSPCLSAIWCWTGSAQSVDQSFIAENIFLLLDAVIKWHWMKHQRCRLWKQPMSWKTLRLLRDFFKWIHKWSNTLLIQISSINHYDVFKSIN